MTLDDANPLLNPYRYYAMKFPMLFPSDIDGILILCSESILIFWFSFIEGIKSIVLVRWQNYPTYSSLPIAKHAAMKSIKNIICKNDHRTVSLIAKDGPNKLNKAVQLNSHVATTAWSLLSAMLAQGTFTNILFLQTNKLKDY